MANGYTGAEQRIRGQGGSVRVTIGTTTDDRGNGGTALPCAGCYISCPTTNTGPVRVNIGVAASATVGIEVGEASLMGVPWFPIDDVANLYFYSATPGDVIDILYFKG